MNIIQKLVPNFTKNRGPYRPEIIVIHIADGLAQQVYQTFTSEQKSSHYLICRNREIWQFVKDEDTAWANGLKVNPSSKHVLSRPDINPNLYSLSIENEGYSFSLISYTQYEDNAELILKLSQKWQIPLDREHIIGHNEIRKDKICPSPIDVNKIIELAAQKRSQLVVSEDKIEELKKIQMSLLQKVLVALRQKLKELLAKIK